MHFYGNAPQTSAPPQPSQRTAKYLSDMKEVWNTIIILNKMDKLKYSSYTGTIVLWRTAPDPFGVVFKRILSLVAISAHCFVAF